MTYDRPYTIAVSKHVYWALGRIGEGLRGDGIIRPENTRDGVAATLLAQIIETRCPGLLDGFKEQEALKAKWAAKVSASLKQKGQS